MTEPAAPSNDNGPMKAPPATFEFLAQTMFTQALMAFGKIPNPITKEALKNLRYCSTFYRHARNAGEENVRES